MANRTRVRPPPTLLSHGRRAGFTLIELVVTIGIVAVLAAMIFPALTRAREKARCASITSNVKQIMLGILMFAYDHENDLPKAPDEDPLGVDPLEVVMATYVRDARILGEYQGAERHTYVTPSDRYDYFTYAYSASVAEEEYTYFYPPQVRGSDGRLRPLAPFDGELTSIPDPANTVLIRVTGTCGGKHVYGFADGHVVAMAPPPQPEPPGDPVEKEIAHVKLKAYETMGVMLTLVGDRLISPERIKRDLTRPEILRPAVGYFDRNADGFVTASELYELSPRTRASGGMLPAAAATADEPENPWTIMEHAVTEILQRLALDPEDPVFEELPAIANEDLVAMAAEEVDQLFSYENLAALTGKYVARPDVATALCAKLAAAEAAEKRGNPKTRDNVLNAYRNQLSAQTGRSLTASNAAVLKVLSRTLQTSPQ